MRKKSSRRQAVTFALAVLVAVAGVYFFLPKLAGLNEILERIRDGDPAWLVLAAAFEVLSFLGYVALFRTIFLQDDYPIGWGASYQITMAGVAATRFFAAAGAGGVALTYWALRRAGIPRRTVVVRMVAFMVALYGVFVLALLVDGLLLYFGVLEGKAPFELTLVPAGFAAMVAVVFLLGALIPGDVERRIEQIAHGGRRLAKLSKRLVTGPALLAAGTRMTLRLTAERHPGLLGAPAWWAFDIAVLWACFHAFGDAPSQGVLVMGYFVGMMANLLPFFPGGVGAVDIGMVGAFTGFGVPADAAVVAVLTYRGFAFWLPTLPGLVAYLQLRKTVQVWDSANSKDEVARAP